MISSYTYRLLVISKVKGVGKKTLQSLAKDRIFFQLPLEELSTNFSELASFKSDSKVFDEALRLAEHDVSEAQRRQHHIVSILDAEYPKLLKLVSDRPAIIYVHGDPTLFSDKAISVVGTREPSLHGGLTAHRLTTYFSSRGWQIVSGLAVGIDTVAHEATLLSGGSTVAVLAHGLDRIYPTKNKGLADSIVDRGGMLVSEYGYGHPVFPAQFVERDRIQAALARGVVMVQSDENGGSWHASRAALRYERLLMIPEPTAEDKLAGVLKIRGNLKVLEGEQEETAKFLKCSVPSLRNLIPIRSKEEYSAIEHLLEASNS